MRLFLSFLLIIGVSFSSKCQYNFEQPWKNYSYCSFKWQNTLDSIIKKEPNDAYLWQQKSMPYFKNGDYHYGMRYLDNAVKLDEISWLGYRGFMKCIFLKDYENAISDFKDIAKKQANGSEMDHSYHFYIAISYLKLGLLDSTAKYINICLAKPKEKLHYLDWYYAGILKLYQNELETSLIYFDNALSEYSHLSDANYYKGLVLKRLNKKEESFKCLLQAKEDNRLGYSLNEDNMVYVDYPFQVRANQIDKLLKILTSQ